MPVVGALAMALRKIFGAIGERECGGQPQGDLLVEVDDEHPVFRAAGPDERPGGGDHIRELWTHTSAVVHHQSHRDRNVFVLEQADGLPDAIFVDLKNPVRANQSQIGPLASRTVAFNTTRWTLTEIR